MTFQLEAFQNKHVPPGQGRVDAILTVKAGDEVAGAGGALVVGFIVDKSGSMDGERIEAVKRAVDLGIAALDDRATFFVVAFDGLPLEVVPPSLATDENRRRAAGQLRALAAGGGTAMSTGLKKARELFGRFPQAIRQAIFLTDGKNESEKPEDVKHELSRCSGQFECDCWGVGTEWRVGEVQAIASALKGKASLIPDPAGVEAAFRAAIAKAGAKALRSVRLRLWTPQQAKLVYLKQVNPTIADLTTAGRPSGPQSVDYDTGSWGRGEVRDFHMALEVPPGEPGSEMLVTRPSLVFESLQGGAWVEQEIKGPQARIFASWTTDSSLSSRIDRHVAHYTGQDELAVAIETGLARRAAGDEAGATHLLGRAVRIAHESGNAEMTHRLARVVDVIDASHGTVKLRGNVQKAAEMELQLESRTTKRASTKT